MALPVSPYISYKGIKGPVYRLSNADTPSRDEDTGALEVLDANGFYFVTTADRDEIEKTITIKLVPYKSKAKFIRNKKNSPYGDFVIKYRVTNKDQVLDGTGNIVTAGTFDTWFSKELVRSNNKSETDQARLFVLSLNGALSDRENGVFKFQDSFPIDFTVMSEENITEAQVTAALA